MRALRWLAWLADEALDRVPAWEDGTFYPCGHWGCRWGLGRLWAGKDSAPAADAEGQ